MPRRQWLPRRSRTVRVWVGASIAVCASIIVCACQSTLEFSMTPNELHQQIEADTAPVIVDTRSEREYARGHIPGARHVSFYKAGSGLAAFSQDQHQRIIVYCAHGPRAGLARIAGRLAGFRQLGTLKGHMAAWQRQGLPVNTTDE